MQTVRRSWKVLALAVVVVAAFVGGMTWQQALGTIVCVVLSIGLWRLFLGYAESRDPMITLTCLTATFLVASLWWPAVCITFTLYNGLYLIEPEVANSLTTALVFCFGFTAVLLIGYDHLVAALKQSLRTS